MPVHHLTGNEKREFVRTKVVATIGPASSSLEVITQLIEAGVDVFRFNFSHGTHQEHSAALRAVREASERLAQPVAVMQDLSGPKIRISEVRGGAAALMAGDAVELAHGQGPSDGAHIFVAALNPADFLKVGDRVLIADGTIRLIVAQAAGAALRCRVDESGSIRSHAGIAFPDSTVNLPAATDKDLVDLQWGIANQVDYVAISFVQTPEDVTSVRDVVNRAGADIRLIPKIERRVALDRIEEIMRVSDGLLVARGDLGIDLPVEKLPGVQKQLITAANRHGIPVIVATEMLQSMITEIRPTRAEVSDVAWAVASGADAVMLSGETAIGKHPVEAVQYLCSIACEAERHFNRVEHSARLEGAEKTSVADAIAYAAAGAAAKLEAPMLVATTASGTSARLLAKYRPEQSILGASSDERTLRRMMLYWGVRPVKAAGAAICSAAIDDLLAALQRQEGLPDGALAVVIGGLQALTAGSTSVMQIQTLRFSGQ